MTVQQKLITSAKKGLVEIIPKTGTDPKNRAAGLTWSKMHLALRRIRKQLNNGGKDYVEFSNGVRVTARADKKDIFKKKWPSRVLATIGEWWRFACRKLKIGGGFKKINESVVKPVKKEVEPPIKQNQFEKEIKEIETLIQQVPKEMQITLDKKILSTMENGEKELQDLKLFYSGLNEMRNANDWQSKKTALEKILWSTGPNYQGSCAFISGTHGDRLVTGKRLCRVEFNDEYGIASDFTGILWANKEFWNSSLFGRIGWGEELHKKFVKSFKIEPQLIHGEEKAILHTYDWKEIKDKLLKKGNGKIVMLFNRRGKGELHSTLLVNIRGDIFHIDNAMEQSAIVQPFETFVKELYSQQNSSLKSRINDLFEPDHNISPKVDSIINPDRIDIPLPEKAKGFPPGYPLSSPIQYGFREDSSHNWLLNE